MSFVICKCGAIEGPHPGDRCFFCGRTDRKPFTGVKTSSERGVSEQKECPKGRPLIIWTKNGLCNYQRLCPSMYNDCEYKKTSKMKTGGAE